jgi:hypothetical protein
MKEIRMDASTHACVSARQVQLGGMFSSWNIFMR